MARKRKRTQTDEVDAAEMAARQAAGVVYPPGGATTPPPGPGDEHPPASEKKFTKTVALYLRVSTADQFVENQERQLREVAARAGWRIVRVYKDEGFSGSKGRDKRPAFDAMLNAMVRREFDMVAAWSVDRLGRSLQDLVSSLSEMRSVGCDLFLHQQGLDTSTPAGEALFGILGVFAQYERAIIVERVKSGLSAARAKGKRLGKPAVPPEKVAAIREELAKGTGVLKVGRMFSVGTPTVQKIKREMAS